jgi:DNA-binding beta-propeller fold protein YncE
VPLLSPHAAWGCFPDTNGLALGRGSDGKFYLFAANGGTDDVSVIDLERALAGQKTPEIMRIPTQIGPWGIAASPDRRFIVAANRESQRAPFEGNTISIIDVDRAREGNPNAELRRVLVGTSNPDVQTRPFIPSFTPDGKEIIVPNFRANNVSIVDLNLALSGHPNPEVARIPLARPADPDGVVRAARPKGSAVTSDGRYAVISGGARATFEPSGTVWIIDLRKRAVVATVRNVTKREKIRQPEARRTPSNLLLLRLTGARSRYGFRVLRVVEEAGQHFVISRLAPANGFGRIGVEFVLR